MASSAISRELGMRLLCSPGSSSIFVRAASVAFGLGFPFYLSFKALEKKCQEDQEQWLVYWSVYACFNLVEKFTDKLISWFPFYHHAKLAFLMWLQLPNNYGVRYLYFNYVRHFLVKHQARLDRIVDASRNDMNNFVTAHHKEIQAIGNVVHKFVVSAYRTVEETVRSTLYTQSDRSLPEDDPCEGRA
ncbi:hypothetical protein SELMODRAFT_431211 [Selaginella moellendorffii]|uniref:HVA22-like protein n=1 Tax=Selaginella moellendorffii TaxID=88036 RepID=D8TBW1_SELML|nr:HVA22-like protein k [Selaginella moellendorffii]EFJ05845.1 hypothetical protein SELMODRAFT_431211 [Selaginella moellendorffii]|eukprot:XP_002993097.1 HVA22-like protein k [Selaginella moellendorffii]